MKLSEMAERLDHLAESLDGCEWNHPINSAAVVREAASILQVLSRMMSYRRCHNCGRRDWYAKDTLPDCRCRKCGSADTRVIGEKMP